MRYEADHKARTHRKIVRNASRQFRAKGLHGLGVPALMKASGLTHGGFYKHFSSRDDLVVEALEESIGELAETLVKAAKQSGPRNGWKAMVETYLSLERCDRPEVGCPIAALAPDIGRSAPATKERIFAAIVKLRDTLAPHIPGRSMDEKRANFLKIMTSMVGAIAIARMFPDRTARRRILNTVRDHLLKGF